MRLRYIAATILVLSLIACGGPDKPGAGVGPANAPGETPTDTTATPTSVPLTLKRSGNTLIETPEYTGVIFSEKKASEFNFLFDEASTKFWEPSIDDVSRAEQCIKQYLTSAQDDPDLYPFQTENAPIILENLGKYRRQYVGIVVDGEKRIWTNSFFPEDAFPEWERAPVYVLDGGNDFWQIQYDPQKDECTNFYVHGEG